MSIKKFIKSIFHKIGFDIINFYPDKQLNSEFAILPLLISKQVATGEPFFFVQVGANDGVRVDPLHDIVIQYSLPGLLIEPLPDMFDKLKYNYNDQPQLLFENVAIFNRDELVPIYRVRSDLDVSHDWMHGIASFSRENLLKLKIPIEQIETVFVQGTSLKSLLIKHDLDKISLLQIDTEGYDFEIIKSVFDDGIFPDIINYEHIWLTPNSRYECKKMLHQHNYKLMDVGNDTLAVKVSKA
jgi:FkbM family methyltransferase